MRKVYSAYPLMLAVDTIVPGTLLETRWRASMPVDTRPQFTRIEGLAWDVLGEKAQSYRSQLNSANILVGTLTDKFDFAGHVSLPHVGVAVASTLANARTAALTIGQIKARTFTNGFSGHILRTKLRALQQASPDRWKWVDDDFLITECYYTGELTFTFRQQGNTSAQADLENAGVTFGGGFQASWKNDHALTLKGTARTPFAVRGVKV